MLDDRIAGTEEKEEHISLSVKYQKNFPGVSFSLCAQLFCLCIFQLNSWRNPHLTTLPATNQAQTSCFCVVGKGDFVPIYRNLVTFTSVSYI